MLEKFKSFILSQELLHSQDNVLLAVSGGLDSMCLAELFRLTNYNIAIAHLNHGMRDDDSDNDELLCRQYAAQNDIPFFTNSVSLKHIKTNFQAEARKIRYGWLTEIADSNNYNIIATAHHKNDQIENFFIRINRTSGLQGLSGIRIKTKSIIRPLLFAKKTEIKNFVINNNVPYRHDESNFESKYDRNYFRNKVIPVINERFPHFDDNLLSSIKKISEANELLKHVIANLETKILMKTEGVSLLSLKELKSYPSPELILFYLLNKYGLNRTQTDNLYHSQTGSVIEHEDLTFLKNRANIIIRKKRTNSFVNVSIPTADAIYHITNGKFLGLKSVKKEVGTQNPNIITVDADKMVFPLYIRTRLSGDEFHPKGMKMKKKKIKKYLTDLKLSRFQKEDCLLLLDAKDRIVWVVGLRQDERFKTQNNTRNKIQIQIQNNEA